MRLAILSNLTHSGEKFLAGAEAEIEIAERELATLVSLGVVAVLATLGLSDAPAGGEQPAPPINPAPTVGEGSVAGSAEASASSEAGTSDLALAVDQANASPSTGEAGVEAQAEVAVDTKPKAKAAK